MWSSLESGPTGFQLCQEHRIAILPLACLLVEDFGQFGAVWVTSESEQTRVLCCLALGMVIEVGWMPVPVNAVCTMHVGACHHCLLREARLALGTGRKGQ